MNKWMKTYWRSRKNAEFQQYWHPDAEKYGVINPDRYEIAYCLKIKDYETLLTIWPEKLNHIKNPSEELLLIAARNYDSSKFFSDLKSMKIEPSEKVKLVMLSRNGHSISLLNRPSDKLQVTAVTAHGNAILDIIRMGIKPSEEVQLAAVRENGHSIWWLISENINPSNQVKLAAVSQNGSAIQYITEPSEDVQIAAVSQYGLAIQYIDKPSEDVQITALKSSCLSWNYIKKEDLTNRVKVFKAKHCPTYLKKKK